MAACVNGYKNRHETALDWLVEQLSEKLRLAGGVDPNFTRDKITGERWSDPECATDDITLDVQEDLCGDLPAELPEEIEITFGEWDQTVVFDLPVVREPEGKVSFRVYAV